jgi:hypothetical protein
VVGPEDPGHAVALTHFARVIKVGVLPSQRVMLHTDQRYYDLSDSRCPLRAFTIGFYLWSLPDEGQDAE